MALTHATATRNALADAINTRINLGAAAGKLKIYKTSIDNPTDANLLVALVFADPAAPSASARRVGRSPLTARRECAPASVRPRRLAGARA